MITLCGQADAVADGEVTPSELVDAALAGAADTDTTIGAFVRTFDDRARRRAAHLDTAPRVGPLHGVPIAVKDIIAVDGGPTEAGCAALVGAAPAQATVIDRLEAAGAIVIGKTHTHELAYGTSCPASRNPWDRSRMTGGSSGGNAAAVAAGVIAGSVGTDTGASVRLPAAYCGISGLKTSTHAVPRDGVYLLSYTFDTVGPMARSAADCRLLFEVMAGASPLDPYSIDAPLAPDVPSTQLRVGVPDDAFHQGLPVDEQVLAAVDAAVEALEGVVAEVVPVRPPRPREVLDAVAVVMAEPAEILADLRAERGDAISAEVRALLEQGAGLSAAEVIAAHHARVVFAARWASFFAESDVDVVITPVTPNLVPGHGTTELDGQPLLAATIPYTLPVNAAWLPALALPGGFDADGLPVGVQLVGPRWSDRRLLTLGEALQSVTDHHLAIPTGLTH